MDAHLDFIEIETSKKCNRKCKWCPVGIYGDRNEQQLMNWELFQKIIRDLVEINYSGVVALHNYNEPLLNDRLIQEISYIKTNLTEVRVSIFTNGDYVNSEKIDDLRNSGLDSLRITVYPNSLGVTPDNVYIYKWLARKGLNSFTWEQHIMPDNKGISASSNYRGMEIKIINPNLYSYNTRANVFQFSQVPFRKSPCTITSTSAAIDYLGRFKMCCNVYPELTKHKKYLIGNMNDSSFYDLWMNSFLVDARRRHISSDWGMTPICNKCVKFDLIAEFRKV